ncbi:hypothetical protein EX895_000756 [Sporisorium graminicola]|uniref:Zn(2)-C6 fungal-type domain-containing protein n=1 Tax=Sporisorium graminicola TaxID=280036 RepID=A0A4U7L482_9BASI|nr:hypothetical protein EX895_000756 [Sporisorium graminicola]TKY90758.1 hypothetical protein EX895_000756 [Sporisorium graminicola]
MDGDSSRGPPHPRDRLPPRQVPSYRPVASARDDALRMRSHPDPAHRYPRSDLEPPPPLYARVSAAWADHEQSSARRSYSVHDAPPPSQRQGYPYSRPNDSQASRYPPSDLPRQPRSTRPDDYYAEPPPADGSILSSRYPLHSNHYEEDLAAIDGRVSSMPASRDSYRPTRPLSGEPKMRVDGYPEPPYQPARPPQMGHSPDPRSDAALTHVRSPGPAHSSYARPAPPRSISDSSQPYPLDPAEAPLHRDKRARLDLYSERPQPHGPESLLRPPLLHSSSSHRSIDSAITDWAERADPRDHRARDFVDTPYHADGASKAVRSVEWADAEKAHSSRRTSGVSHHTFDAGFSASSEQQSINSQSSKVKRRKRAVLSCTECKQRKIKCDRNVPNCGSCVRRGVAHLCRWGDERDYLPAAPSSNITPSNAALMARIAQLESQVRVLQSSSSTSPTAALDAGASERSSAQRVASKYGASASSSGHSSRFSGRSSIQYPPDFTSRDRNASSTKVRSDGVARPERLDEHDDDDDEAESEQSDESAESGDENTGDLLRALAQGTSLKNDSRPSPPQRDQHIAGLHEQQADGIPKASKATTTEHHVRTTDSDAKIADARDGHDGHDVFRSTANWHFASAAMPNISAASDRRGEGEARRLGLLQVLDLLPSRAKTEALVEHYLREAEPMVQSFHAPSLWKELSLFWNELDRMQNATDTTLPPSLAELQFGGLLLAICESACEFMTPAEVLESEICTSRTSINAQLSLLVRSCLSLLGMGQFVRHPTIWGLQAIVVLRHYCFNRDHRDEYRVISTMAIKASEFIGLHHLGSALRDEERWEDEERERARAQINHDGKEAGSSSTHRWKMLTSTQVTDGHETDSDGDDLDPDRNERKDMNAMWLPRGARRKKFDLAATKRYKDGSRVNREHGRKVWFAFACLDWLCAAHFDRCYHCHDEMFTTQSPQNIDDADLTDSEETEVKSSDDSVRRPHRVKNGFLDKIRIVSMPTTNSFIPIQIEICHTVRSIADALNQGDDSFDSVLAIEARLREILRSLPRFFKLDGESEYDPEIHRLHQERPYLSFQRAIIHEHVHHRLLKLHRLYMSRGYWNAKYIHSTRTCIESARVVMGLLRALDNAGCRGQRYWIIKFHIFHALLALQVDLLYLARQPVNREILAKRADVVTGLKMLHMRTDVEGRNPVLASSLKVIKVLREEEQARRATNKGTSDTPLGSEATTGSSPAGSAGSHKKAKVREWTRASELTGDLAEHLERRVSETWYTVDATELRTQAEAASNLAADARSPDRQAVARRMAAISRTPSTQDGSSLHTAADAGASRRAAALGKDAAPDGDLAELGDRQASDVEGRDTELDDYLKLLSSYQNPDDAPDGAHFFDVLDDMVFENGSTNKPSFGGALASELVPNLPLLRGPEDLAAAGPGFDALSAA